MRKNIIKEFNKTAQQSYLLNLKNKVTFNDMVKKLEMKQKLTKEFLNILSEAFSKNKDLIEDFKKNDISQKNEIKRLRKQLEK